MKRALVLGLPLLVLACTSTEPEPAVKGATSIIGGRQAFEYPEAVAIASATSLCTGALISPYVVLTAGHCVQDDWYKYEEFEVTAPFAGQSAYGYASVVYDYTYWSNVGSEHDVALIFLSTPIVLSEYPKIASAPIATPGLLVPVGRKYDDVDYGTTSIAASVPVSSDLDSGRYYAYRSQDTIDSGDSGGPVFVPGTSPHVLAAVNSAGIRGEYSVYARVDDIRSWILSQTGCGYGDGLYCGGNGAPGERGTLYRCTGGTMTVVEKCANGCVARGAGESDSCASAACESGDGWYCGGNGVPGDPNTLYECAGGKAKVWGRCANGCVARTPGVADDCRFYECASGDGVYCGGNGVIGDTRTLYTCAGGVVTASRSCANGCMAMPPGYDDTCR